MANYPVIIFHHDHHDYHDHHAYRCDNVDHFDHPQNCAVLPSLIIIFQITNIIIITMMIMMVKRGMWRCH